MTEIEPAARPLRRRGILRRALSSPKGYIPMIWIVLVVGTSMVAPLTGILHPLEQHTAQILAGPGHGRLLGTDQLGRDILARLIYGGKGAFGLALETVVVSILVGTPLGLLAGFRPGWGDFIASRFADLTLAIPGIVVLLAVVAAAGNNMVVAMAVLGVLFSAGIIRLVRASTLAVTKEPYVDAARVSGLGELRIALRHVLPNVGGPLVVQGSLIAGASLLTLTGLQFIGLGPNPPAPSWGGMVSDASANLTRQPWMMIPSGAVVMLTVLAFNTLGDSLRDALGGGARPSMLHSGAPRRREGTEPVVAPAAPGDVLVEVSGLEISLAGQKSPTVLVDGVSLAVRAGETLGIVGESGSGKTLTALSILGLLPSAVGVSAGSVRVGEHEVTSLAEHEMRSVRGRRVGYVPQEPMVALDPNFTIGSQLVAPLRRLRRLSRGEARAEAVRLLARTGIPSPDKTMRSYPHQISGGMAQRVCIALALTGDPDVLVADEPTTALDVTVQAEVLDLLRELSEERGLAIILVTHNLGVVADLCEKAIVMYAGQVVESGATRQILSHPTNPYTAALLDSVPSARGDEDLTAIEGVVPQPQDWPRGCRFADRCALVQEECRVAPIPLIPSQEGSLSRCIRVNVMERTSA